MTAETLPNTTKTFKFSFPTCTNEDVPFHLQVPVEIPLAGSARELVQRVINMFHIPVYLEDELNEKLASFVAEETQSFHNERDKRLLDQLKCNEVNVDTVVKQWEKLYKETVVEFAEDRGTPDCEVLAAAHQRLSQTPAFETMLQSETAYARAMHTLITERDKTLHDMAQRQAEEMDSMVLALGTTSTEADINALARAQWAACAAERARWGSRRDALSHAQRAQHTRWRMDALAEHVAPQPGESPLASFPRSPHPLAPPAAGGGGGGVSGTPRLEESFTIHLGSQLKLTHNIRIAAMDLLDLTTLDPHSPAQWSRRMQTALSLYSTALSCVVLLSDSLPTRMSGHSASLVEIARRSTDHHFDDVDDQLRLIAEQVRGPVETRNRQRFERATANPPPPGGSSGGKVRGEARGLCPGDVFVTRHSNLADVNVVFHLIVDDSLRSGDISSRHPVILGLRSILRACAAHDVTAVALPLLLAHQLTEEMTLPWCARRAELVLKCVKGFALETAGGGGADIHTLSLSLPQDIDPGVFHSLAALTPTIFRLSNPVKVKASPT